MSKCPWARYRTPNRSTTDYSDKEKCILKKYYIIVFLSLYRYLIDIVNIKNSKLEFLLHNYTVTLWVSMTRKHPLMALKQNLQGDMCLDLQSFVYFPLFLLWSPVCSSHSVCQCYVSGWAWLTYILLISQTLLTCCSTHLRSVCTDHQLPVLSRSSPQDFTSLLWNHPLQHQGLALSMFCAIRLCFHLPKPPRAADLPHSPVVPALDFLRTAASSLWTRWFSH